MNHMPIDDHAKQGVSSLLFDHKYSYKASLGFMAIFSALTSNLCHCCGDFPGVMHYMEYDFYISER